MSNPFLTDKLPVLSSSLRLSWKFEIACRALFYLSDSGMEICESLFRLSLLPPGPLKVKQSLVQAFLSVCELAEKDRGERTNVFQGDNIRSSK